MVAEVADGNVVPDDRIRAALNVGHGRGEAENNVRPDGRFDRWLDLVGPLVDAYDTARGLKAVGDGAVGGVVLEPGDVDLDVARFSQVGPERLHPLVFSRLLLYPYPLRSGEAASGLVPPPARFENWPRWQCRGRRIEHNRFHPVPFQLGQFLKVQGVTGNGESYQQVAPLEGRLLPEGEVGVALRVVQV